MNVEEKLKEKSFGWKSYNGGQIPIVELSDAISICKLACKKQREICEELMVKKLTGRLDDMAVGYINDIIINAPEPWNL